MRPQRLVGTLLVVLLLGACASAPTNPARSEFEDIPAPNGLTPGATVPGNEGVGFRRSPGARLVQTERRSRRLCPCVEDRSEELPRLFNPIAPRVERRVAVDRVQQEPLVRLGRLTAENLSVAKIE